jgi:geranylgeranyl diphosphate synthase type 3
MLGCCDIMENLNMSPNYHQSGMLRQRTGDIELKKYCVTLLEKFGSLRNTRHNIEELDAELRAEVAKREGDPILEDILDEMLDWKWDTNEKHSKN